MKLLQPIPTETKIQFIVTILLRLLIPILASGITIHFAIGARNFVVSFKSDLARIEKKLQNLETIEKQNSALASPVRLPLNTVKRGK